APMHIAAVQLFFSSRRRHTSFSRDWSSDVCSSDLRRVGGEAFATFLKAVVKIFPALSAFASFLISFMAFTKINPSTTTAAIRTKDRKSTRLNSSHVKISYAVFCLKKKKHTEKTVHN